VHIKDEHANLRAECRTHCWDRANYCIRSAEEIFTAW